jgi:hypothetical protein
MKLRKRHKRAIIYIKVEKPDNSIFDDVKIEDSEDIKLHEIQPALTCKTKIPAYNSDNNNNSTSNKRIKKEILLSNSETKLNEISGIFSIARTEI